MRRWVGLGVCLLLSVSSFAQVRNAGVPSDSESMTVQGGGSVPMRYDRHQLFVKFWGFDYSEKGTLNQMQAWKVRASRRKEIVAALARIGLKPASYAAPRTGLPDDATKLEFAFAVPDGACDGEKIGAATRAELVAAVHKISPFSSLRLESSASPAVSRELRRECLALAVKDAKEQARAVGDRLGVEPGKLLRAAIEFGTYGFMSRNLSLSAESVSPMGPLPNALVSLRITYSIRS